MLIPSGYGSDILFFAALFYVKICAIVTSEAIKLAIRLTWKLI